MVPVIRKLSNKPILFDAYLSVYDTMIFDRGLASPNSFVAKGARFIDHWACNSSHHIVVHTHEQLKFFTKEFGLSEKKFSVIPSGADDTVFYPRKKAQHEKFRILFYGSFVPVQGTEYIVRAAKVLAERGYHELEFRMIGDGIMRDTCIRLAKKLCLTNVRFLGRVSDSELVQEIAEADICLAGHFGSSMKALREVPGKTFQMLAMKKPTIVSDSPASREFFEDGKNTVFSKVADENAIAECIRMLFESEKKRQEIACAGFNLFKKRFTPQVIGQELAKVIGVLISSRGYN
ncbi:MAG: glycosyltransferase [Candidatus Micrarchaeia archaeon]